MLRGLQSLCSMRDASSLVDAEGAHAYMTAAAHLAPALRWSAIHCLQHSRSSVELAQRCRAEGLAGTGPPHLVQTPAACVARLQTGAAPVHAQQLRHGGGHHGAVQGGQAVHLPAGHQGADAQPLLAKGLGLPLSCAGLPSASFSWAEVKHVPQEGCSQPPADPASPQWPGPAPVLLPRSNAGRVPHCTSTTKSEACQVWTSSGHAAASHHKGRLPLRAAKPSSAVRTCLLKKALRSFEGAGDGGACVHDLVCLGSRDLQLVQRTCRTQDPLSSAAVSAGDCKCRPAERCISPVQRVHRQSSSCGVCG